MLCYFISFEEKRGQIKFFLTKQFSKICKTLFEKKKKNFFFLQKFFADVIFAFRSFVFVIFCLLKFWIVFLGLMMDFSKRKYFNFLFTFKHNKIYFFFVSIKIFIYYKNNLLLLLLLLLL